MSQPITYCTISECGRKHYGRGYCNRHYKKWRKYGNPLDEWTSAEPSGCEVQDCQASNWCSRLCQRHYALLRRYGNPTFRLPGEVRDGCHVCVACRQDRPASEFSQPGKSACRECLARRRAVRATFNRLDYPGTCAGCGQAFLGTKVHRRFCSAECRNLNSDYNSQRRARMLGAPTEPIDRLAVFIRDDWTCALCQEPISRTAKWPAPQSASLDHDVPLARGGSHTLDNVQAAHLRCNLSKGARGQLALT